MKEQYEVDVKRIRFTLQGHELTEGIHEPERCPFCNGVLEKEQEEDCLAASHDDLESLEPKIKDLEKEIETLQKERNSLDEQYQKAFAKQKE